MGLEKLYPKLGMEVFDGDTIFSEGDESDAFYLILGGKVKIIRYREDREIILAILMKNQFFGEMGAFRNTPRTASAVAITETKLLRFPSKDLLKLIEAYPEVGIKILKVLANRLLVMNKRLDMLSLKNFRVKLLRSINAIGVEEFNSKKLTPADLIALFDLHTTKEELADFISKSKIGVLLPDGSIKFNRFLNTNS
jgi:CRP/FNR family transcriptional regulator